MQKLVILTVIGILGSSSAAEMSAAQNTEQEAARGVVVEEVGEGSALAKAGIEPGDVLLSWRRLPSPPANLDEARGEFDSAFDWMWLVVEQAPRGTVELIGRRGREERVFTVALGLWEAEVRPWMPARLRDEYLLGRMDLDGGNTTSAAIRWEGVASTALDWRVRCWMKLRIGKLWVKQRAWDKAHTAYRLAIEVTEENVSRSLVLRGIGEVYLEQGDLVLAQHTFESASEALQRAYKAESLALARNLTNFGIVASRRGDLRGAIDIFERALQIQEEQAPNSLGMAASLHHSGIALGSLGDIEQAAELHQRALEIQQALAPDGLQVAMSLDGLGWLAKGRGDLSLAADSFQRAMRIRQKKAPDSLDLATSLHNLGVVAKHRGDLDGATEFYELALEIRQRRAPGSLQVAQSLNNLGVVAKHRGDFQLAIDFHERALAIRQTQVPNSLVVVDSLVNLGLVAMTQGDLLQARVKNQHAHEILKELAPDSLRMAACLVNMGSIARHTGDLHKAKDLFEGALEIRGKLAPGSLSVARILGNLGILEVHTGNLDRATVLFQDSLKIRQELAPGSIDLSNNLLNLGVVADIMGDFDRAIDLYRRALEIQEEIVPRSLNISGTLNNLGAAEEALGNLDQAEEFYNRSVAIRQELAPDSLHVAECLNNLGVVARDRGELRRAEGFFKRALKIQMRLAPSSLLVANSLGNLGSVAWGGGDLERAKDFYYRSSAILQILASNSIESANALQALGLLYRESSPPQMAIADDFLRRAIETLESQLAQLGGAHEVRSGFRARYERVYRDALEIQLKLGTPATAFHTLERSRARSFLEHLTERDSIFSAEIPEEIDRERRSLAVRLDRTQQKLAELNPQHNSAKIDKLLDELRRQRDEAREIESRIRRASPRQAALLYPQPLDLAATRETLDPGTLLLSYSVAEKSTLLFTITKAQGLQVDTIAMNEEELSNQAKTLLRLTSSPLIPGSQRMRRFEELSRHLFSSLIEPVNDRVETSERLLILADGPLHYLPWGALIRNTAVGGQYLVEWKPFHLALSATVYAEIHKLRRDPSRTRAGVQVAAFGDPRYPDDRDSLARGGDPVVRFAADRGFLDLGSLPHTRREVESIADAYGFERVRAYLGDEATEEHAKSLDREARIVHFATHGYVDERFPLNSFLALTIPAEFREGDDNGLLQAWEIFERMRLDADLVVLSACETAVGEERGGGEGLIGLARAFQYAGARSVAASLWSVADQTTAELMIRFYRHLRSGLPKDEALRAAQLEFIPAPIEVTDADGRKTLKDASAPYYWAGFQIYGDWQ